MRNGLERKRNQSFEPWILLWFWTEKPKSTWQEVTWNCQAYKGKIFTLGSLKHVITKDSRFYFFFPFLTIFFFLLLGCSPSCCIGYVLEVTKDGICDDYVVKLRGKFILEVSQFDF